MSKLIDRPLTAQEYDELAWAYYRTLPLEHFMESPAQATQRKIALESLDLLHARRPEVQVYSELLVQYRHQGELKRVVPDNMIVLCDRQVVKEASFNIELEPAGPFCVLEWVSASSEGKDYGEAFQKYERDLQVPYCLMYYPEEKDLRVHRLRKGRYELIPLNAEGRFAIPELDLEIGMLDGWARFWHRGALLELPAALEERINELKREVSAAKRRANQEKKRADQEKDRADREAQARQAAEQELARLRGLLGPDAK